MHSDCYLLSERKSNLEYLNFLCTFHWIDKYYQDINSFINLTNYYEMFSYVLQYSDFVAILLNLNV